MVFLHFEVWVADSKVFDVKFDFSMSKSPRGQVLSRFHWIGDAFARVNFTKTLCFLDPFMGLEELLTIFTLHFVQQFVRKQYEAQAKHVQQKLPEAFPEYRKIANRPARSYVAAL